MKKLGKIILFFGMLGIFVLVGGILVENMSFFHTLPPIDTSKTTSQREVEILQLLHKNLKWYSGGIEYGAGWGPSWERANVVKAQLTDADIPVLIQIIKNGYRNNILANEKMIKPDQDALLAQWVLSLFEDKAKLAVEAQLHESNISDYEKSEWEMFLGTFNFK